jgi:predicted nucleotide-binding protein
MNEDVAKRLGIFAEAAWNLKDSSDYESWIRQILAFLNVVADKDVVAAVDNLGGMNPGVNWRMYRDRQVSHLEGLAITLKSLSNATAAQASATSSLASSLVAPSNKVFIVHGHDVSAKESTARFLEKLDLVPVVLHEQANEGQTVIEKFESHANVGFAVILLTPDDVGANATTPEKLQGRARQNVILELGYFTGKLGRRRVCALFRPGVEVPSDFHGVLFTELDAQGGWKTKLAQELVSAGLKINLQGLLH